LDRHGSVLSTVLVNRPLPSRAAFRHKMVSEAPREMECNG